MLFDLVSVAPVPNGSSYFIRSVPSGASVDPHVGSGVQEMFMPYSVGTIQLGHYIPPK